MKRIAVVTRIHDSWIDLLSLSEMEDLYSGNRGAFISESCARCSCRGGLFRASISKNLSIKVGDKVEVSASNTNALSAFLTLIGIPTLVGILSWKLAGTVLPAISEPARAIFAALGLSMGVGITFLLTGRKRILPVITRILK